MDLDLQSEHSLETKMASILHFVFGIFGNVTALFLFMSPIITFSRIIKNKSTEQFSGVPYVSTLMNCLLSAWYGLPFVSPHNLLVSTINGTGAAIELIYVLLFLFYAPKKIKTKIFTLFMVVLVGFATIALVSLFALHGHIRKLFCGLAATIFSICMYASPLSAMRLVIKTKSVEYMPFFLSLFVFLCGTSWFIYGLLGNDPFIAVPNGFGCFLGAVQLILYAIYRDRGSKSTRSDDQLHESESMEMGYGNGSNKSNQKVATRSPLSEHDKPTGQANNRLESALSVKQ